jgi:four helix bundle protein
MFDFQKLEAYQCAKRLHLSVSGMLKEVEGIDRDTRSQLRRASMSICLNLAEGAGRLAPKDKRHFYIIARGSVAECVCILDLIAGEGIISSSNYSAYFGAYDRLSRMLWALINKLLS